MIAEVPVNDSEAISADRDGEEQAHDTPMIETTPKIKVFTVRVRVGGVLVSSRPQCVESAKNFDSAMQQVRWIT